MFTIVIVIIAELSLHVVQMNVLVCADEHLYNKFRHLLFLHVVRMNVLMCADEHLYNKFRQLLSLHVVQINVWMCLCGPYLNSLIGHGH